MHASTHVRGLISPWSGDCLAGWRIFSTSSRQSAAVPLPPLFRHSQATTPSASPAPPHPHPNANAERPRHTISSVGHPGRVIGHFDRLTAHGFSAPRSHGLRLISVLIHLHPPPATQSFDPSTHRRQRHPILPSTSSPLFIAMSLSNPINAALLPAILFVAYRILFPSKPTAPAVPCTRYDQGEYNWAPTKHPKVAVYKDYDVHELSKSDGRGTQSILLAIARIVDGRISERTVFDVSAGANFYGPDGMYGNFAGRDASRGMAKQSFDEEMLTDLDKPLDDLKDLTPAEIDNMHGWHDHFSNKYKVVGRLV